MTGSAHGESRPAGAGPETVRVVRPGHPLHGLDLPVWGRLRLRGVAMVVLVLPDGSRSASPQPGHARVAARTRRAGRGGGRGGR